jgi:multidrug efflux pump
MIFIMTASMVVALIFLPAIGTIFGKPEDAHPSTERAIHLSEHGNVYDIPGWIGRYARIVTFAVQRPFLILGLVGLTLVAIVFALIKFNHGVEFFVQTDSNDASVYVRARGNLSAKEKLELLLQAETRLLGMKGVHAIYAVSGVGGGGFGGNQAPVDTIGRIAIELVPYEERGPAKPIWAEVRKRLENLPGMYVELFENQGGPPTGKAIQVEVGSENYLVLDQVTDKIRRYMDGLEGLRDIEDSRSLPGIEWALSVKRPGALAQTSAPSAPPSSSSPMA